jgi:hypothetical protein
MNALVARQRTHGPRRATRSVSSGCFSGHAVIDVSVDCDELHNYVRRAGTSVGYYNVTFSQNPTPFWEAEPVSGWPPVSKSRHAGYC